ncbi:ankyrin repeat domain-containing protein [Desulfuribacillus stibiiarsenatis]|nr:ankyrin repeat domain-containing protein [Desulfuribacillus stibiiarsenatis]
MNTMIESDENLDFQDSNGWTSTPLMLAIKQGNRDVEL